MLSHGTRAGKGGMSRIVGLIDRLSGLVGHLGAWLVVPLFVVMTWEVTARYFFDAPTFWAYEFAYMLTGSHFVLGIALVLRQRQHIRVDFLYARLSPRLKDTIDAASYVCFLLPAVWWIAWRLGDVAWEAFAIAEISGSSAWNPVIWPLRSVIAFGFALFGLQLLAETWKTLRRLLAADATPA
jgi:TRAP-type mannitol/chloroaromatic compound transport system permease small subunit